MASKNFEKLIAALGLDAEGEVALRRVKDENNIRDNDPDVLAALAIARVDGTLRKTNELVRNLDARLKNVEIALKNG